MNRNKEYRLKRKSLRKDYIIQDKNVKINRLYYLNENKKAKIDELKAENKQLKELCDKYEKEHSEEFKIWLRNNNVIRQLKQWLEEEISKEYDHTIIHKISDLARAETLEDTLNKIKELEGVKDDEV